MLSLSINEAHVKGFMRLLFKETVFDALEMRSVIITSFARLEITSEHGVLWQEVKPYVFDFIKGRPRPDIIKIVFSKSGDACKQIHPNARALFLNMNYEAGVLRFTTATSQKEFSLNKDLDQKWETYIEDFFKSLGLPFEIS